MMFNLWPYLIRLAVALYFIYPHAQKLAAGAEKLQASVFSCINEYIPMTVAFTMWHAFFVVLGVLILIWPAPVLPLVLALVILSTQLYINFSMNSYSPENMLIFVLLLVTLSLIIYHSRPQR